MALALALTVEAAAPKRVLILHSFGRDFAPYDTITSVFRTELARRSAAPITFVEANLDFRRAVNGKEEQAFIDYLRARFDDEPPDLVVTIGPSAARFHVRHRDEIFQNAPTVLAALDERFVQQLAIRPTDAVVAGKVDLPKLVDNVLRLLPDTRTIAIVLGASELERFWRRELQREFAQFAGRVEFEWLQDLSLEQMQDRLAHLPPHSAVLYGLLIVDAAGVPHERQEALASLRAVTHAPIFGLYENELGKGVVGGPYTSQRSAGERIATEALRALATPEAPRAEPAVLGFESPVYDWRELAAWHIDHARLPPGSEIRFKPPSIWDEHAVAILAAITAILAQAALIAALLLQRTRRRSAEQEAKHLGGRILTAQEDERRRLAREMHDDVTQRLAAVAIDAAKAQGGTDHPATRSALDAIRLRLVKLSEDVHALSYRLHPSVIEDLGLVAALKAECNRVSRNEPLRVEFDSGTIPRRLPSSVATCLFRVAQEALRNVVRHANASSVEVSLETKDAGIGLVVRDDGHGFADARGEAPTSLGLVSMRERVRLLGGRLEIATRPNQGTSISAWVPLQSESS